jgi:hypothetical protein
MTFDLDDPKLLLRDDVLDDPRPLYDALRSVAASTSASARPSRASSPASRSSDYWPGHRASRSTPTTQPCDDSASSSAATRLSR